MDWIDLAKTIKNWRAVVNTAMNRTISWKKKKISWLGAELLASQEEIYSA